MLKIELKIETAAINPPKPLGFGVFADGKLIGSLSIEDFEKALADLRRLQKNRR